MKRFAEVKDSVVRCIHEGPDGWTPQYEAGSGLQAVDVTSMETPPVQGSTWSGGLTFVAPTPPAPHVPTAAEAMASFRAQREILLTATDYVSNQILEYDQFAIGDLSKIQRVVQYRQALRDMPNDPEFDPANPVWPAKP